MSLWLTKDELAELTGYKRVSKQRLALAQMNVKFRTRPYDGVPLVERWQFEGESNRAKINTRLTEPNWDALKPRLRLPKGRLKGASRKL